MFSRKIYSQARLLRGRSVKFFRLLRRPSYWAAMRNGVAASVEHSSIGFNPDTRTVLDVGASHGQFALLATQLFPRARIVCFEPLPGPRAAIRNVLGDRVEIVPSAVGTETGLATINISAQDDSSSLLPIGEKQVEEFPGTGNIGSLEVPVTTLDEAVSGKITSPCLLKIDVQGLELDVLKGASETLPLVDEALIECSFVELYEGQPLADEIVNLMISKGLRLRGVHGVIYSSDGSAVEADIYFSRVS